ncbi:3-dehydroquinate synthase [Fictibacillus sp. NRS-1165]|uniref:3-dehydroquinate synthase n=1 Tax=Fictibacillus sp. NRS-1165 TaxID=3144463 RepID=UPI003D1CF611
METLQINTESKKYPVFIGNTVLEGLAPFIQDLSPKVTSILIISDETVNRLYFQGTAEKLECISRSLHSFVIPSGDREKSFDNYYKCLTFALEKGLDRHSLIIALGGGMIGDLAGFVAGTYMRGIRFIQLPTTLLAHDSAVGGKTGINHPLGKNMVGVFHQPEAVFYSTSFLKSLAEEEWRSGFAEVIKHSLIADEAFYHWLVNEVTEIQKIPDEKLAYILKTAIAIKAQVVAQDERESGLRAILNFGHTLGHAIESKAGYGAISHGDAVSIGMRFALKLSESISGKNLHYIAINKWFRKFCYPVIPPQLEAEALLETMKRDKKSTMGHVKMVLLQEIGQACVQEVNDTLLLDSLEEFIMADKEQNSE